MTVTATAAASAAVTECQAMKQKPSDELTIAKVRAAIFAYRNQATAAEIAEHLGTNASVVANWLAHRRTPETRVAFVAWRRMTDGNRKHQFVRVYSVVPVGEPFPDPPRRERVLEPINEDDYERPSYEPTEEEIYKVAAELRAKRPRPPVGYSEVLPVETPQFGLVSARLGQRIFKGK